MRNWFYGLMITFGCTLWAELPVPEFTPALHVYGMYGTTSAEHPADFAPGGHDPDRDQELVLQSLEPSVSMTWGNYVQGFVTGIAYTDERDDLEWEWEEYFLKLTNLPGGFELRGGRMLNRIGFHNPTHLHSWNTVDMPLPNALFLGEHGLTTEGADLSLYFDTRHPTVLTIGFGQRPPHDHEHDHGEEDHAGEEDHDHEEDHEEEEAHDHDHEGFGALEEYRVQDDIVTVGLRHDRVFDDFNRLGLAAFGGMGDAESGAGSWFAGAGVEYAWRENGLEPGGRAVRWRTEVIRFYGDAPGAHGHDHEEEHGEHEEEGEDHDHEEDEHGGADAASSWGISTELLVEAHEHAHPFVRIDYVDAVDALELSDWTRTTAGLTIPFGTDPGVFVRLQANFDERGEDSEQAFWTQFGFDWGGPEVR